MLINTWTACIHLQQGGTIWLTAAVTPSWYSLGNMSTNRNGPWPPIGTVVVNVIMYRWSMREDLLWDWNVKRLTTEDSHVRFLNIMLQMKQPSRGAKLLKACVTWWTSAASIQARSSIGTTCDSPARVTWSNDTPHCGSQLPSTITAARGMRPRMPAAETRRPFASGFP